MIDGKYSFIQITIRSYENSRSIEARSLKSALNHSTCSILFDRTEYMDDILYQIRFHSTFSSIVKLSSFFFATSSLPRFKHRALLYDTESKICTLSFRINIFKCENPFSLQVWSSNIWNSNVWKYNTWKIPRRHTYTFLVAVIRFISFLTSPVSSVNASENFTRGLM